MEQNRPLSPRFKEKSRLRHLRCAELGLQEASSGPSWFEISQGSLTIVLAFIVARIAYLQYKTSHDKLRLDLYSKRFAVFATTRDYLVHIIREANLNESERQKFWFGTTEAEFLFKADLVEYLRELHSKGIEFRVLQEKLQDPKGMDDKEANELIEKDQELLLWFSDQMQESKSKFGEYLGFE